MVPEKNPGAFNRVLLEVFNAKPVPLFAVAYKSHVLPSARLILYLETPFLGDLRGVIVLKNTLLSMEGVTEL